VAARTKAGSRGIFGSYSAQAGASERGTLPALWATVIQTSSKTTDTVQQQVDALTVVAKKLSSAGKEAQALEAYQKASELMLGAPWLQHRTAELARKLKQPEVASLHYRRAAAAFIGAGFPKRALAPLRTAWQLSLSLLPGNVSAFIAASMELANIQSALGHPADATLTLANANQALETSGNAERLPTASPLERAGSASAQPGPSPDSGLLSSVQNAFVGGSSDLDDAHKP